MNSYTHFYLYAKGHYMKSDDIIDDLKYILSERSAIPVERCLATDIVDILLSLVYKHITESGNPEMYFKDFIIKLKRPFLHKNVITYEELRLLIIKNSLSILEMTNVKDLNLGEVDENILPLRKN